MEVRKDLKCVFKVQWGLNGRERGKGEGTFCSFMNDGLATWGTGRYDVKR